MDEADRNSLRSPYYTNEDFKKYATLLSSLERIGLLEQLDSVIGTEFIGEDGKKYIIGDATIREIESNTDVQYHRTVNKDSLDQDLFQITERFKKTEGREDSHEVLKEKAIALALLVLRYVRIDVETFLEFEGGSTDNDSQKNKEYLSLGELFINDAALHLCVIERFARSKFSDEDHRLFYDYFRDNFIALALLANYEKDAPAVQSAFINDLNKRIRFYSKLPFVSQKDKEAGIDNQMSQFSIISSLMLSSRKDPVLRYAIETYELNHLMVLNSILGKLPYNAS